MPSFLTIVLAIIGGLFWTLHNKGYRDRFFAEKRGKNGSWKASILTSAKSKAASVGGLFFMVGHFIQTQRELSLRNRQRLVRLTNGFSKKLTSHAAALQPLPRPRALQTTPGCCPWRR
jgi:hypothetical protein